MNRIILVAFILIFQVADLLAGPGGKIAKTLFDNPLGKVLGVIFIVVFFPFIIRSIYKRKQAVSSTKSKLDQLTHIDFEIFDEINLRNRVVDVFTRVHKAWSERDLDGVDAFMTSWYRQNQQSLYLDEWDRKNLMNICTIREIIKVEPIHIRLTPDEEFNGSRIMFAIRAEMEDYLVNIKDSSVIEGKKGFNPVETVWTLKLHDRVWRVDNIEQSEMVSSYMKMNSEQSDLIIERLLNGRLA